MDIKDFLKSNRSYIWSGCIAGLLKAMGCRQVVVSPGSRSGPLAVAFEVIGGMEVVVVLDERSAGFTALGMGKRNPERPVVLIATSGTAGANYYGAVMEAYVSKVPLIVITADRPRELQGCHAPQTADQVGMFGKYVKWGWNVGEPVLEEGALVYLRRVVMQAWERALGGGAGPVHLNVGLEEPLDPVEEDEARGFYERFDWKGYYGGLEGARAIGVGDGLQGREFVMGVMGRLREVERGIILVGPELKLEMGKSEGIRKVGDYLGWPVLVDGANGFRYRGYEGVVTRYGEVLKEDGKAEELRPEVVLCIGDLPTSKVLRKRLTEWGAEHWVVENSLENIDGMGVLSRYLRVGVEVLGEWVEDAGGEAKELGEYFMGWLRAEEAIFIREEEAMGKLEVLTEGRVGWDLRRLLEKGGDLFVGNSLPLRHVERYLEGEGEWEVFCNRGINGIDGVVSTAMGAMRGRRGILWIGELSFLHDVGGLLQVGDYEGELVILVTNNGGGGIFEYLPIAKYGGVFEKLFKTPREVGMGKIVEGYGCEYEKIGDLKEWEGFVEGFQWEGGNRVKVVEIMVTKGKVGL